MKRDGSNPQKTVSTQGAKYLDGDDGQPIPVPADPPPGPEKEPPIDPQSQSKTVKFATICVCGKRSEEYTSWAECVDCGDYICPDCQEPDTFDAEANHALCREECIKP